MIGKLLRSVRDCKGATLKAIFVVIIEVIMETIVPFLMMGIIDDGIYGGSMPALLKYGGFMLLCVIIGLVSGAVAGVYSADASAGFARNLRQDLYYKIQGFSFSNIDKFSTPGLVTRLTTDVTNIQNAYQMSIRLAIRAPLTLIFALVMSFSISWKLALIFLAAIPVLGGGLCAIVYASHPIFEKVFHIYDDLNGVVEENVSGIRVVKSFVREDHEKEKFGKISGKLYTMFNKAEGYMALNTPLMRLVIYICLILVFWFGARLIVLSGNTELTTGELTTMISYAMGILTSLMQLSMVLVMMTIAQSSARRVVEVLDEESTIRNGDDPVEKVEDGSITFEHVDFAYDGKEDDCVLHGIDLNIPAGTTVGIIGGTGSSKTSLVSLIPRLYDVTEGAVKVGGRDVREYDLVALRDAVAMVLQKNELFSGSIKENLRWGDENATDEELVHACKLACADEFIQSFPDKYDTHIEQGGTNVSGGQKQRLCIARALLKKPKILILDDSTSAVDTKTDALIRKAFREELPETTKIIIAQRITSVQDADMIVVMDGGKIDGIGTHEELLKGNEIYRDVYLSQQKGGEEHEEN